jgi:prophage tail gpP-like protein
VRQYGSSVNRLWLKKVSWKAAVAKGIEAVAAHVWEEEDGEVVLGGPAYRDSFGAQLRW